MEVVEERAMTVDELQMGLPGIAQENEETTEADTPPNLPPQAESSPPDLVESIRQSEKVIEDISDL